jgi:hypothetical protein
MSSNGFCFTEAVAFCRANAVGLKHAPCCRRRCCRRRRWTATYPVVVSRLDGDTLQAWHPRPVSANWTAIRAPVAVTEQFL